MSDTMYAVIRTPKIPDEKGMKQPRLCNLHYFYGETMYATHNRYIAFGQAKKLTKYHGKVSTYSVVSMQLIYTYGEVK